MEMEQKLPGNCLNGLDAWLARLCCSGLEPGRGRSSFRFFFAFPLATKFKHFAR